MPTSVCRKLCVVHSSNNCCACTGSPGELLSISQSGQAVSDPQHSEKTLAQRKLEYHEFLATKEHYAAALCNTAIAAAEIAVSEAGIACATESDLSEAGKKRYAHLLKLCNKPLDWQMPLASDECVEVYEHVYQQLVEAAVMLSNSDLTFLHKAADQFCKHSKNRDEAYKVRHCFCFVCMTSFTHATTSHDYPLRNFFIDADSSVMAADH